MLYLAMSKTMSEKRSSPLCRSTWFLNSGAGIQLGKRWISPKSSTRQAFLNGNGNRFNLGNLRILKIILSQRGVKNLSFPFIITIFLARSTG